MVAVPSALHLASGLLAVAVAAGLALALHEGGQHRHGARARPVAIRWVGTGGALVYGLGHLLAGALLGPEQLWSWLHVVGLAGIAAGTGPGSIAALPGAALLVPVAPTVPSYVAAALALIAAARFAWAGRRAVTLVLGLVALAAGHALTPTAPTPSAWAVVAGALLIGAWLWSVSSRRILAKLLTAFVSALLAMAILMAAVLSTVSSAELTTDELARLSRLAGQLTEAIRSWPAEAIADAQPLSRSVTPLVDVQLSAQDAADLYDLSLSGQDFFLTVDASGEMVNSHPPDLVGSLQLALAGDPLVADLRDGGASSQAGGLLSTGEVIVGFGAVALRDPAARPEDPPAGVLVTGRLVDPLWAAQQAAAMDVGLVGFVADQVVFSANSVGVGGAEVLEGLEGRQRADLSVGGQILFAASAPIADPERGTTLGQLVVTSTPQVIADVERGQNQRLFVAAVVGAILAVVVATVVTRRFTRPLTQLTAVARQVEAGDLSSRARIEAPDEVGVLGATFDEMVSSLDEQRRDLTESAAREARLRGRLESLTASMADGLVAVDADGRVITFNPAAEILTGRAASEVLGLPLETVLVGRGLADGGAEGDGAGSAAGPRDPSRGDPLRLGDPVATSSAAARLVLSRADGTRVPVAANAAPVRAADGAVMGRVLVLRDISRELEVEQMKSEFLSNVSHEMRTPLTPIKGYASVLAKRPVDADSTRRFAHQILDATGRLERIVEMIVDFAGLDSGRVTLDPEPVDLHTLVGRSLERWRERYPGRTFTDRTAGPLPPVAADAGYLRRCLDELIDNAVKFSPGGQPVVVAAGACGDGVALQVVDGGIGIEASATGRLFTDFMQLDGTETRHYGGLGLGLGLVKRILDGIGGRAEVRSQPERGTTVTVHLTAAGPVPVSPLPAPPGTVPSPPV